MAAKHSHEFFKQKKKCIFVISQVSTKLFDQYNLCSFRCSITQLANCEDCAIT